MWRLNNLDPKVREWLYIIRGACKRGKRKSISQIKKLAESDAKEWYANAKDVSIWEKSFMRLAVSTDRRGTELAKEFYACRLEIISEKQVPQEQPVVLICIVKDEMKNIRAFYQYYKSLGVGAFAIVDNKSTDDTVSVLSAYPDVNLYSAPLMYTSIRRQAWINRIMAHYGFSKWYIVVDSDEYLTYNEAESRTVGDVIDYCDRNNILRMQAMMVDMYPKTVYFNGCNVDFLKEYKYFDTNTYYKMQGRDALLLNGIQGGVRARLFAKEEDDDKPWLTKYPLLFLEPGDIQYQSHMSFPFYKNFASRNYLVLRHYKFMPTDYEKYKERVKKGNFANGSQEYIQYVKEMTKGHISFYDEKHSAEYINTHSLYQIPELCMIPWEN